MGRSRRVRAKVKVLPRHFSKEDIAQREPASSGGPSETAYPLAERPECPAHKLVHAPPLGYKELLRETLSEI